MTEVEALKQALSKEHESIKQYLGLSVQHPNLKELFYFLMNEEEKHVRIIEEKIISVTR